MTHSELVSKLFNHSDFALFRTTIFKTLKITESDLYPSGDFDFKTKQFTIENNEWHVRLGGWNRIGFDSEMTAQLQRRFDKLNAKTQTLKFELTDTCDFDEDDDRTWDARIYFRVVLKTAKIPCTNGLVFTSRCSNGLVIA